MLRNQLGMEHIGQATIRLGASIRDAMEAIGRGGAVGIALVVDACDRLVGTVTDGDIRRALLGGATLDSRVQFYMQRDFTTVGPEVGRAEALDLMRARVIAQIPIIDAQDRPIGIHLLREMVSAVKRPNWGVIMAGGKGVRLRPITEHLPKPMIPVAGRPILERLILHMVGFGVQQIFLAINYLGHMVEEHFGDGHRFGCQIEYLRERMPLGTGGALSLLPKPLSDPVLVMNGDLVTQADLGAMLDFHCRAGHQATIGVKQYSHVVPYGCVEVKGSRIICIEEKPMLSRLVNAGIYVLNPQLVARVPLEQEFPMTSLLEQAVALGESVGAFQIGEDWIDVGQRDQLRVAQEGAV